VEEDDRTLVPISSVTGEGVRDLIRLVARGLEEMRAASAARADLPGDAMLMGR